MPTLGCGGRARSWGRWDRVPMAPRGLATPVTDVGGSTTGVGAADTAAAAQALCINSPLSCCTSTFCNTHHRQLYNTHHHRQWLVQHTSPKTVVQYTSPQTVTQHTSPQTMVNTHYHKQFTYCFLWLTSLFHRHFRLPFSLAAVSLRIPHFSPLYGVDSPLSCYSKQKGYFHCLQKCLKGWWWWWGL